MRSNAVLFKGVDQVVTAYLKIDIAPWALWGTGKDLIFSYSGQDSNEGLQLLQQALEMLAQNESQAILTLKVYDDLKGKITSATPYSNSFNFALFDPEDGMVHMPPKKSALLGRITALEELILQQKKDETEPKSATFMDKIGAIMDRPDVQDMLIKNVVGYVKKIFGGTQPISTMGNVQQPQPQGQSGSAWESVSADQQAKLQQAMEILMKRDPLIGDHMLALANMSVDRYNMALKFL